MICLVFAYIVSTSSALPICTQPPKVEIIAGESKVQMESRLNREAQVRPSPGFDHSSDAKIIGDSSEQCVQYAKRVTGISRPLGYAGNTQSQGNDPQVGAIALERSFGHAMVVVAVADAGITIHEANFVKGHITERFVPYSDVRGYVYN